MGADGEARSAIKPKDSRAHTDRWGLFVSEWGPTSIVIGITRKRGEQGSLPRLGMN